MIRDNVFVGSVISSHAGESIESIFERKINDINSSGKTFWLVNSYQLNLVVLRAICINTEIFCYFVLSGSSRLGSPTKIADCAKYYSVDKMNWNGLPNNISNVTGKINKATFGLVFDSIEISDESNDTIDLWSYNDINKNPIKIIRGSSTFTAIKSGKKVEGMKSRFRIVVARGHLVEPYCVYLKK